MSSAFSFLDRRPVVFTIEALSCLGLFPGILVLKDIVNGVFILVSFSENLIHGF